MIYKSIIKLKSHFINLKKITCYYFQPAQHKTRSWLNHEIENLAGVIQPDDYPLLILRVSHPPRHPLFLVYNQHIHDHSLSYTKYDFQENNFQ